MTTGDCADAMPGRAATTAAAAMIFASIRALLRRSRKANIGAARRLVVVELVHDRPKRGEGVLREIAMQLLVVLGAHGLAVFALANLEPALLDLLAHRMRRHRRAA